MKQLGGPNIIQSAIQFNYFDSSAQDKKEWEQKQSKTQQQRMKHYKHVLKTNFNIYTQRGLEQFMVFLNKKPKDRIEYDVNLLETILSQFDYFNKLKEELSAQAMHIIYKNVQAQLYNKNNIIFEEGSYGSKFFFII
jgi:hypothetical protein